MTPFETLLAYCDGKPVCLLGSPKLRKYRHRYQQLPPYRQDDLRADLLILCWKASRRWNPEKLPLVSYVVGRLQYKLRTWDWAGVRDLPWVDLDTVQCLRRRTLETDDTVAAALQSIPAEYRDPVRDVWMHGYNKLETAERYNIHRNTLNRYLVKTLESLRRLK